MRQTKVSFVVAFAEKVSLTSLAGVMPSGLDCLVNAGSFVSLFFLGWKIDRELLFPYPSSLKTDRLVSCTTSIVAILSMFSALPYLFRKSSAKVEPFLIPCKFFAVF